MQLRKLRRQLNSWFAAYKAPNFNATAGQAIVGALGRGPDGRFARVGSVPVTREDLRLAKAANRGPKKGKAGKLDKTLTDDKLQALGATRQDLADAELLKKNGQVDQATAERLVARGFASRADDGSLLMTPAGRQFAASVRRGDAAGVTTALSKVNETRKRESEQVQRQSARDQKRAERDAARQARQAETAAKRGERQAAVQQRQQTMGERRAVRLENRLEEMAAKEPKNEDQRMQMENRLEELALQVSDLPNDLQQGVQAQIDKLREKLSAGPPQAAIKADFAVFKDAAGQMRWITYSSTPYQDVEKEIVAQKALENAVNWADVESHYGPLRLMHTGFMTHKGLDWTTVKAGPGWDIGDADFMAMHGRVLVESGTFRSPELADVFARNASKFKVSIGFTHPLEEPVDGVYSHIRIFERSIVPAGAAANQFTGFIVTGG